MVKISQERCGYTNLKMKYDMPNANEDFVQNLGEITGKLVPGKFDSGKIVEI